MTTPAPGLVRCSNCRHGSDMPGTWCPVGQRVQRRRTLLTCTAFEDRHKNRPAPPMTCAACGRSEAWLPSVSGVPLHPECSGTALARDLIADHQEQVGKRRQQRELARARAGIQAQAAGLNRCLDCTRFPGRGKWCAEGRLHANGSWRRCEHWTDQARPIPDPEPIPRAGPLTDPTAILEQLRAHPAVVSVEATPTGIMLRICKSATERQRGEVAVIMAGRVEA